jgi:hypothetical protein
LRNVTFEPGHLLYEPHAPVDFVYFPQDCVLSAITVLNDGTGIEVGTIGNEGAAGLTAFIGPSVSPTRLVVQIPGTGMRIVAGVVEQEARSNRTLHDLLLRHLHAFLAQMSQSVACNGVHPIIKRCCQWLLMTHDRVRERRIANHARVFGHYAGRAAAGSDGNPEHAGRARADFHPTRDGSNYLSGGFGTGVV